MSPPRSSSGLLVLPPPTTRSTCWDHLPSPSSAPRSPFPFRKSSVDQPRAPSRSIHAPLMGFDAPLQRIQRKAPVSPGGSTLRHVPSLGTLTPSTASFALHLDGLVSSRPTLLGFARSPPSGSGLRRLQNIAPPASQPCVERRSRDTLARPFHHRMRPPPFRAAKLIPGSLSRAFSPPAAARALRPGFLPCTSPSPSPVARTTRCGCFEVFTTRGSG